MSKKKHDAAAELAGRMLEVLETRRTFGGDAHPPTLQELGELADPAASPDRIVKAASKKVFTGRATVPKVDGKPSLDEPVYFKGEEPRRDEMLSRRLLNVLESQRRLGGDAYPPTLRRLAELGRSKGPEKVIRDAAALAPFSDRATVVVRKGKSPDIDAPVLLNEDLDGDLATALPCLLRFTLSPVTSKTKKGTSETTAFAPADLSRRVIPELKPRLERAVREGIGRLSLPHGVGWVTVKGEPLLFLTENLRPAAAHLTAPGEAPISLPPRHEPTIPMASDDAFAARDFTAAFRSAFEILDRRNGSTNFVTLADLRQALADFSRDEFDAGLRQLRIDGAFSLDSHEGLHGSLSHEERDAGVREAGSLLVYASRR